MKYTDKLNKPITLKRLGLLAGKQEFDAAARENCDEALAKPPDNNCNAFEHSFSLSQV